jgi:alginate O-acetyltransferase complex protein AlgI
MNFAEIQFWELLVGGMLVIAVGHVSIGRLRPALVGKFDKAALLGLGLLMLQSVSWVTFIIFLFVAGVTYAGLGWVLRRPEASQRRYLFVLIPLQLAPLFYYKYAGFVLGQFATMQVNALAGVIIPVGISFYTFQKVAFAVDTLHFRKPLPAFLDYMNFAGFFPQVVAGPIERRDQLLPQMERFRFRWSKEDINVGAGWIALGLFFKLCLADNLVAYFDPSSATNAYLIWLANLLFGLRIYYDFAGYGLVAFGLARCLGINLTLNFESPYCATSCTEFWHRWNITLSRWFRDYIYVPLGGGRTRWWPFNVAIVFIVSGLWHGAGWNFLLWGALHGGFLITNRIVGPKLNVPAPAGWLLTVVATYFAWLSFYELRVTTLLAKAHTLVTPAAYGPVALREAFTSLSAGDAFTLACLLALIAFVLLLEWQSARRSAGPYSLLLRPASLTILVVLTVLLAPAKHNAFIYFAF